MALMKLNLEYRKGPDGMMYPVLDYPKQPEGSVGKYGEMRRAYLQDHRKATYATLRLEGKLKQHLMDVNEQAHNLLEQTVQNLMKTDPAPDKATDTLGWVQHMNSLKHQAEEIVLNELVYA